MGERGYFLVALNLLRLTLYPELKKRDGETGGNVEISTVRVENPTVPKGTDKPYKREIGRKLVVFTEKC